MRLRWKKTYQAFFYYSVWADLMLCYTLWTGKHHRWTQTMLCGASAGGLYLTYVRPRRLYVAYLDHVFEGKGLMFLDLVGHHLPLLLFSNGSPPLRLDFFLPSLWIPLLYIMVCPYPTLYGISLKDLFPIFGMYAILYFLFSS